jgi:hypothetical protein
VGEGEGEGEMDFMSVCPPVVLERRGGIRGRGRLESPSGR